MDERPNDPEFEAILRLVRDEEESALEAFRRTDFRQRLEARLGELPGRTKARPWPMTVAVPAGAAALLLVFGWAVFLRRDVSPPKAMDAPAVLASGLENLPGMAAFSSRQTLRGPEASEAPGALPILRGVLTRALDRGQGATGAAPPDPDILRAPRLSLERKMAILFKDKAIERGLALARKKSEEV